MCNYIMHTCTCTTVSLRNAYAQPSIVKSVHLGTADCDRITEVT